MSHYHLLETATIIMNMMIVKSKMMMTLNGGESRATVAGVSPSLSVIIIFDFTLSCSSKKMMKMIHLPRFHYG